MKWLSNANALRAMDVALIMPALFVHVRRRRRAGGRMKKGAGGGGVGGGDIENKRG